MFGAPWVFAQMKKDAAQKCTLKFGDASEKSISISSVGFPQFTTPPIFVGANEASAIVHEYIDHNNETVKSKQYWDEDAQQFVVVSDILGKIDKHFYQTRRLLNDNTMKLVSDVTRLKDGERLIWDATFARVDSI